jgi:hypothetical protein
MYNLNIGLNHIILYYIRYLLPYFGLPFKARKVKKALDLVMSRCVVTTVF